MDLTGNRNMKSSNEEKIKKTLKTTIVILSVISILIIILIGLLYVQKKKALKIFIDGADNTKIMDSKIVFEGDKIYIPIKTFAKQVGYEVFDGEYKQSYIEDKNKCYIKNKDEVTSYVLDSNQIYKKIITTNEVSNYEYFEIDEPVKKINGELYASINGISNGCNVAISYNKENNKIDIYTLSKLVTSYTAQGTKFEKTSALVGEDVNYSNQKAILYGMMVVKNDEKKFGVCDLKGQTIIGTKYKSIKFIESLKSFIVKTDDNKVGIITYAATPIIPPEYDNIEQINNQLYLVAINKKFGIINKEGKTIVYSEYDQIGVDATKYPSIDNQYIMLDKYIPVMKDKKWGMYNTDGQEILGLEYDEIGCTEKYKSIADPVVVIPKYELIVAKKNNAYGLVDGTGKTKIQFVLKNVYSVLSAGVNKYYMLYEGKEINIEDYLEQNK